MLGVELLHVWGTDVRVSTAEQSAKIGLVVLGDVVAEPGSAGHPASYSGSVMVRALRHRHLRTLALRADPSLYPMIRRESERLVDYGATGIITTCGYFTPYQRDLAHDLTVPVLTSSLMQLPMISQLVGARSILVLASNGLAVDARCLSSAGVIDPESVQVRGMEGPGPFRTQVFDYGVIDDIESIVTQAILIVRQALDDNPEIGAVCIECGELAVASRPIRTEVGLPVFDYFTAARQFREALLEVS